MQEFFKGGRRKLGLLSLLAACVCTAGWTRSLTMADQIGIQRKHTDAYILFSGMGVLGWEGSTFRTESDRWNQHHWDCYVSRGPIETNSDFDTFKGMRPSWCWEIFGLHLVIQSDLPDSHHLELFIKYRSIVIPLTALSVWLLLFKHRPLKSASANEL